MLFETKGHPSWQIDVIDPRKPLRDGFSWKEDTEIAIDEQEREPTSQCPMCNGGIYYEVICQECIDGNQTIKNIYCCQKCLADSGDENDRLVCGHQYTMEGDHETVAQLNARTGYTAKDGIFGFHDESQQVFKYHIRTNRSVYQTAMNELSFLEDAFPKIKMELEHYLNSGLSKEETPWVQAGISTDPNRFKQMHLILMGKKMQLGMVSFPFTTSLFEQMPVTLVTLSVIEAMNRVSWHAGFRDYSEHVIRCHLPLLVPKVSSKPVVDQVGMNVMNQPREMKEGMIYSFDDCDQHEAYNFTSEPRYILIFDLIRPTSVPHRFKDWNSPVSKAMFDLPVPFEMMDKDLNAEVVSQNFDVLKRIHWDGYSEI